MTGSPQTKAQLLDENAQLRARIDQLQPGSDREAGNAGLSEGEPLHRITMSSVSDVVFVSDDSGRLTYVSPNVHVIFGCSARTAMSAGTVSQLLGSEVIDHDELALNGDIKQIEHSIYDASGAERHLQISVKQVIVNDGTILYTCRDVTEQKTLLAELRSLKHRAVQSGDDGTPNNDQQFQRLVEGLKDGYFFFATDPEGVVTYVSPSAQGILGYLPEQVVGNNWRDFVDLSIPVNQRVEVLEQDRFAGIDTGVYQCIVNHADGGQRVLELRDSPVVDDDGNVISNEGIAKDITARHTADEALRQAHDDLEARVMQRSIELKKAYDRLRESEVRYRSVVEDQTELIVRWRPDGGRTFVNQAYSQYFGLGSGDLAGGNIWHTVADEDRDAVRAKIRALSVKQPVASDERRAVRHDGSVAWHQWSDRAFFDEEQALVEIQSVGRDITQRKKAEEEALQCASARDQLNGLSPRERDVMELVVAGLANKVIGRQLDVSIKTVEKHRASVMKKLNVRSVPELVRLALLAKTPAQ